MNKPQAWWREPTKGQWAAFAAAWIGWVLDAFDFTIYLLVMKHIAAEFPGAGLAALSGSITLTLLVRLLGGLVAGWMADRWGRRLPLMLSLVWFAVFDAAIYFAPSFAWILVLRTLFGFGMGAEWTAGTALAMESFPARSRAIASGLLQAGWPIGFLLAAVIAYFVVPAFGWRAMFLIAAVPALLVLPIRLMVPAGVPTDAATPHSAPAASARASWRELAAPPVRNMIILGSLVMALGFAVYYGLTAHYVLMLIVEHGLAERSAFVQVILFNVGMLVGVVAAGAIAKRWGVVVALVVPALLMVPALPLYVGVFPSLLGVGAVLGGALGVGYSGVTPMLTTSLFPTAIRARAIGLVYHAGALLAAFVPWLIAEVTAHSQLTLGGAIAVVVGIALIVMAAAVLALRNQIAPAEAIAPAAPTAIGADARASAEPATDRALAA